MTDQRKRNSQIAAEEEGLRLDRVLAARIPALSRSRLKALILDGQVAIDGAHDPRSGRRTSIPATSSPSRCRRRRRPKPAGEDIPLNIVYEDDALIVIDKPAGLVVHPAAGHANGTLVNALIAHCGDSLSGIGGVKRPGIVHRLDKDTTGLMVVAKTDDAHRALIAQFANKAESGLSAAISPSSGARPAGRKAPSTRRSTAIRIRATNARCAKAAAQAVTHWQVLERIPGADGKPVASLIGLHARHRPHPPDPRASGPYRPSDHGRRDLRTGFKTKASLLSPPARAALEALGRQALHAYPAGHSNTPTAAKGWNSDPNCRRFARLHRRCAN